MATEELKTVTVFVAGLGEIGMRLRTPREEIIKEFRGESDNCHPNEAIFLGTDDMEQQVHIHITRHNVLGYVIKPYAKRTIESIPGPMLNKVQ